MGNCYNNECISTSLCCNPVITKDGEDSCQLAFSMSHTKRKHSMKLDASNDSFNSGS